MSENEVNLKVKEWLEKQGYHYKGILNKGKGQVAIPDGNRQVLLDHQGIKDSPIDLVWVEAKGSGVNFSGLLEGFIRTVYAIYHGGGDGFLATPHAEYQKLLEQKDFLEAVALAVNGKGTMGLLDVEKDARIVL